MKKKFLTTIFALSCMQSALAKGSADDDWTIVPARSLGKIQIGMTAAEVETAMGKPTKSQPGAWLEYVAPGSTTDVFLDQKDTVSEIRFSSKKYHTANGISLSTFNSKRLHDQFDYDRLQHRFMNTRQLLKGGGLAFYQLNLDSTDPNFKLENLGLVFDDRPLHEPISIEGEKANGWHIWDGSPATLWDTIKRTGAGTPSGTSSGFSEIENLKNAIEEQKQKIDDELKRQRGE